MPSKTPPIPKKLTIQNLVKEICRRDNAKGTGYDLKANHVSAVLKHLFDIFLEADIKNAQRKKGKGSLAIWPATPSLKFYTNQLLKRARAGNTGE